MTIHVLLGGNGYLGREVARQWLAADPQARFIVVSSSGANQLTDPRVTTIAADATSYESLAAALPQQFDTIVNFLGCPGKNDEDSHTINVLPVRAMQQLAAERGAKALGYIGGKLGPKKFTATKADMIAELRAGSLPLAVVEPTVIYGGGRSDALAKMVPLFKFLGIFSATFKPVTVEEVAADLVAQLTR